MRRALEVGRHLVLLCRAAARNAGEDPLLLAVQAARRLPRRLAEPAARVIGAGTGGAGVRDALAAFVADRPDAAVARLSATPRPRTRLGRRLAWELAVQLGLTESVECIGDERRIAGARGGEDVPALTRARAAWQRGDVTGAAVLAGRAPAGVRYRERLESERATMLPGFRLSAPERPSRPPSRSDEPRALHLLTNSLPHTRSGYSVLSHSVLRSQRQAGIAVEAVTRIGYPVTVGLPLARGADRVDGVTYRRVTPASLAAAPAERLAQMVRHVVRLAETFQPTVVHTTTNYTNALVAEAVARATGLPWVYEVRGQLEKTWLASRPPAERDAAERSERYGLLRAKETEMVLAADHVVTLSETMRADLLARGADPARVTVVPHAIDSRHLAAPLSPPEARARLGLPVEGFWVGSVSSLVDYEGLDILLDAVARLRRRGLDVRAAIVGDGVSRPSLLAATRRLGIEDASVLPGRVRLEKAALWHRALDVFAVPRRDLPVCRAVTPLKPIEAMAAGRAVVASDLPALAEIITGPGAGLLVPPEDAKALADTLARLVSDPQLLTELAEAGRSYASDRTWHVTGSAYRTLYERLSGE
ncbi:glycosyltransferase family 4 protein [Georgenia sp. SUBG003]|uniref:glycosyltransferase family 4 protein n=1 Tax=Georgenia sp. SUBG003 TaxID=1497974 RepID=UPI0004DA8841|nr:hypothetical protein DA06_02605 [Georgenia sp. SUBG003]